MSSAKDSWRTAWLRGGRISEVAWIGQDTIAWCSGIHLVFFDVPTNKLLLPRFSYDIVAAGASCLSGHPSHSIFAFAEKILNPRIHVYAYPSMATISECAKGTSYNYLATTFVGDFLVSLDSLPNFSLIFWSWRTGEKITNVETSVCDAKNYGHTLKANYSMPSVIAQIGKESSILLTWEVSICNKTIFLNKNNVVLPKKAVVQDVAWSPDSSDILAIVDRDGVIYISNPTGSEIKRIVLSQRCTVCPDVEQTAICWYRGGIVLRTTFCQIRYYQNIDNHWGKLWSVKCIDSPTALTSHPFRNDRLLCITAGGHIVQINCLEENQNCFEVEQVVKQCFRGKYLSADFLQPWEDQIIAVDESMELSVIEVSSGSELAKIYLENMGKVTVMVSHPRYPLIVVSSNQGEVMFVSFLDYYNPKILGKYRLQSEILDIMEFSSSGRYLLVCQRNVGNCYLFNIFSSNSVNIRTRLEANIKIVDIMLFETENSLKLYILEGVSSALSVGHKLVIYEIYGNQDAFKKVPQVFGFTNYFQRVYNISDTDYTFVATPYLTKQIRFYKITDTKDFICWNIKTTGHSIRHVKLFKKNKWLITSGLDGLLTLRKVDVKNNEYFSTHHRHELSITQASVNSAGNVLITLGVDGSIVSIHSEELANELPADRVLENFCGFAHAALKYHENKAADYANAFNKREIEFLSEPMHTYMDSETSEISWIDWKKKQKFKEEERKFRTDKNKILVKLKIVKSKIFNLLNKNETNTEQKKLPMSAFNLDKVHRERRMKSAKDEREETRRELELNSHEMERVIAWIKNTFWDTQLITGQSIFGLFDNMEVTNYPLLEFTPSIEHFNYSLFQQTVYKEFLESDILYPWEVLTGAELNEKFERQLRVKKSDEVEHIDKIFEEDDEPPDEEIELQKYILEGVTTFYFIQPIGHCHSQYKTYAFSQLESDEYILREDRKKLRLHFNKLFDEMHLSKQREMNLLRERVDRIHHISSELQLMFNVFVDDVIKFPEWDIKEIPEKIIETAEDELPVKPYISTSEQNLLDKQAAEEEMTRLAMMADDFRERAVQAMMDGVLEIRWEDIIKKDPPKPACILVGKSVDEYTDEDNLAVKRYEQALKNLELEREKYLKMLQTEYVKINKMINEGMAKFNVKLEEFYMTKMKVEAALQQLNLQMLTTYRRHFKVICDIKEEDKMKKKIQQNHETISRLTEAIRTFENIDGQLQNKYEKLLVKNKYMEKKFKNDFPSLPKASVAILYVQYKRRPRNPLKDATPFEVLDLGKSIIAVNNLPYLTPYCLDYLKQLATLDIRPANLPDNIEASHWQNCLALRRLKIDHELKLRSAEISIEQAIEVLTNYNRNVEELKLGIESMKKQLKLMHAARVRNELNSEVQLVIKMGQTEVEALHGDLRKDMTGAILVPRTDVERVNNAILAAGDRKLKAIKRNLEFQRGIEVEQWELDCSKMKVSHLEVAHYFAKTATLTRKIRDYLSRVSKGLKEDKTPQKIKREFEVMRKSREKVVMECQAKLKYVYEEVQRVRMKNEKLDEKITKLNVNRCEMELQRDIESEERNKDFKRKIFQLIAQRAALVRKLLQNYEEIVASRKNKEYLSCIPGRL